MSQIWGMINSMQVFSHLPALTVDLPNYSNSAIASILEISSFEVIPVSDFLDMILTAPDGDGDDAMPAAIDIEYESYYMIKNLGALLVIFCFIITVPPALVMLLQPFIDNFEFAKNKRASLVDSLRGNMQIRFIVEGCLDIFICVGLQFYYSDLNGGLNFRSVFMGFNTVITVILGLAVAAFIPFVVIFYSIKFSSWDENNFVKRYGEIFDGLRKVRKSSLFYPFFLIFRRLVFTVVALFASEYFFAQIFTLMLSALI